MMGGGKWRWEEVSKETIGDEKMAKIHTIGPKSSSM